MPQVNVDLQVAVLIIVSLQIVAIVLLVAILRDKREGEPTVAKSATVQESPEAQPAPESGPAVHATLRRNADGEWECDGKWVREGTEAWQQVHDTPGRALRLTGGTIIEGVQ